MQFQCGVLTDNINIIPSVGDYMTYIDDFDTYIYTVPNSNVTMRYISYPNSVFCLEGIYKY